MIRSIPRALAAALFGALLGPACLVLAYAVSPDATLSIDRLPPNTAGFYPAEREGDSWFVWSTPQAEVRLPGLDRRSAWSCSVRFRGARPAPVPQPDVTFSLDGVTSAVRRATNEYQDVTVTAPSRPLKPGLVFTITTSTPFVPGPSDRRPLGVQITAVGCHPSDTALVLPPRRSLASAALAAALFGAAIGLTGITAGSAVGATALIAAGQSVPLTTGAAPYADYQTTLVWLAAWLALLTIVASKLLETWNGQPLRNTSRFVLVFSAGAVYLQALNLLHPSKAVVDAVFHAHRFESVLNGHFYFTQLSTSATPFPYAIGLYVFAAPWALFTHDHVALLRIVVCASQVVAGALLYLMVVRTWGDRLAAAVAVALFSFVPIAYTIVGYANLTNAFGASVALATFAAATIWPLDWRRFGYLAGLILLATLGFICHISTFLLLGTALVVLAALYRWLGGPARTAPAVSLLIATAVALLLSVALYWGHFGPVYAAQLSRLRAPAATAVSSDGAPAAVQAARGTTSRQTPGLGRTTIPFSERVVEALAQVARNLGWPILLLAVVGAWRLLKSGWRDRLVFAVAAWLLVWVGFVGASVLTAVDMRYQQDAWEFASRVEHMASPAAVILAAYGAAWLWRAGVAARTLSAALLIAASVVGIRMWVAWLS